MFLTEFVIYLCNNTNASWGGHGTIREWGSWCLILSNYLVFKEFHRFKLHKFLSAELDRQMD